MTNYENLLKCVTLKGIEVYELDLGVDKPCGKCFGNSIFINNRVTDKEKYCVLAEEIGHFKYTVGNISNLEITKNTKQENTARRWSFEKLVSFEHLIKAHEYGCRTSYEIAEYLELPQRFLEEAINYYKEKHGVMVKLDIYTIYFKPNLGILKMF